MKDEEGTIPHGEHCYCVLCLPHPKPEVLLTDDEVDSINAQLQEEWEEQAGLRQEESLAQG